MKKFFLVVLLVVTLSFMRSNLQADYLDVGSDPEKIKVVNTQEIIVPAEYKFKGWSPDGEYLAFSRRDDFRDRNNNLIKNRIDRTIVFRKDGLQYKTFDGAAILWSPDSKSLVMISGMYEIFLKNIVTNVKKEIKISLASGFFGNKERYIRSFNLETGDLIYTLDNEIYKYDFKTEKSDLIYKIEESIIFDLKLLSGFDIFFLISESDNYYLQKYNYRLKRITKIFPGSISTPYYFKSKFDKVIIYFDSGVDEYSYFINDKGNVLLKLKGFIFGTPKFGFGDHVKLEFTSFAPNGKIFASTIGKFTEVVDEVLSADIYLFNLSGKMVNLTNSPDKKELVSGWSPQGDKLVYFENKSKKHYMLTLSIEK